MNKFQEMVKKAFVQVKLGVFFFNFFFFNVFQLFRSLFFVEENSEVMVRRSSRSRRAPARFSYNARYEPYARTKAHNTVRIEGRRHVPDTPISLPTIKETSKPSLQNYL